MACKIGDWEISELSDYCMHYAYKKGSEKRYLCSIPFYKTLYLRINYDKFKNEYKLPLLPVVNIIFYKDHMRVIYEEAIPLIKTKNFNTKKIIDFIIEMAKFHYETGYCVMSSSESLFVRNGEICIDVFKISKPDFREKIYLEITYEIFKSLNIKEIYEQINFIKIHIPENRNFESLKKNLLSCLIIHYLYDNTLSYEII